MFSCKPQKGTSKAKEEVKEVAVVGDLKMKLKMIFKSLLTSQTLW
jgi:hypothetical protein